MSCKYCKPIMTIRKTVFFEHIPESPRRGGNGGKLSIRAEGSDFYLHYENDSDVFYNPVEIVEHYPIKHCPMCGQALPRAGMEADG